MLQGYDDTTPRALVLGPCWYWPYADAGKLGAAASKKRDAMFLLTTVSTFKQFISTSTARLSDRISQVQHKQAEHADQERTC